MTSWISQLIAATAAPREEPRPKFNPKPKGVIQAGSATAAVLEFLERCAPRLFTRAEIIEATGHTAKAVNWGLYYLAQENLIDAIPDPSRNERYKRYRARKPARF